MAQQHLLYQVNDLEDKVKNIKPHQLQQTSLVASKDSNAIPPKHCVVDITIFLNHLNSVKKWIADAKCIVIVPLEGKKKKFIILFFVLAFNYFE